MPTPGALPLSRSLLRRVAVPALALAMLSVPLSARTQDPTAPRSAPDGETIGETVDWLTTGAFGDVAARAAWRPVTNWVFDPGSDTARVVPGTGAILDPTGDAGDLYTLAPTRDLAVSGEFILDEGASATLRFLGRYTVLLASGDGTNAPEVGDPGTILGPTISSGIAPRIALPCAPRIWHRFSATVRAPRFDPRGVKVSPARVVRVVIDDVLLQVGVDLPAPSVGSPEFEIPEAPFALGSHDGGVAFRALRGRTLDLTVAAAPRPRPAEPTEARLRKVCVFSRTMGYRHASIPVGIAAVTELGAAHGFVVHATEDPEELLVELADSDVVLFLNTTGDVLDDAQQVRFEERIGAGLGFVGVHSAADTEYDWPFYGTLVGSYFRSHPAIQEARVAVVDRDHPATAPLPEDWVRVDEWYDFRAVPPEGTRILARLDDASYEGSTMEGNHPISWCHTLPSGARSVYTGGGHTEESFAEPLFRAHLLGALRWAAGDDRITVAVPAARDTGDDASDEESDPEDSDDATSSTQTPSTPGDTTDE